MLRFCLLLSALTFLFPAISHGVALDLDLFGSFGLGSSIISSQSSSKPETVQTLGGVAVGINPFRALSVGALTDYRRVDQSSPAEGLWGNRTGTRWNLISPYADMNLGRFRLRFVYQFLGDFTLSNKAAGGQTVTYGDPSGMRGELHFCAFRGKDRFYKIAGKCLLYLGAYYEKVTFGSEQTGNSTVSLLNPLEQTHYGVALGLGF